MLHAGNNPYDWYSFEAIAEWHYFFHATKLGTDALNKLINTVRGWITPVVLIIVIAKKIYTDFHDAALAASWTLR
jgi:hypothetical protein